MDYALFFLKWMLYFTVHLWKEILLTRFPSISVFVRVRRVIDTAPSNNLVSSCCIAAKMKNRYCKSQKWSFFSCVAHVPLMWIRTTVSLVYMVFLKSGKRSKLTVARLLKCMLTLINREISTELYVDVQVPDRAAAHAWRLHRIEVQLCHRDTV